MQRYNINMGKLITIVGNSGVGKTTLTRQLCTLAPFVAGLEQHVERPFHARFALDLETYALVNQVDFMLFRAEQELDIRRGEAHGVLDGGLEEDFYVFTRLFYQKGYLKEEEYLLCQRLYSILRATLLPPDVIVRLAAPLEVIVERFTRRGRSLEIAAVNDLRTIESLLDDWLGRVSDIPVVIVDASTDDPSFQGVQEALASQLMALVE